MRLLALPSEVLDLIKEGRISSGHGRTLLGLDDKSGMLKLCAEIEEKQLSVRQLEAIVKALNSPKKDTEK